MRDHWGFDPELQVLATRGPGERAGAAFAKWLTTDEAAALLTAP